MEANFAHECRHNLIVSQLASSLKNPDNGTRRISLHRIFDECILTFRLMSLSSTISTRVWFPEEFVVGAGSSRVSRGGDWIWLCPVKEQSTVFVGIWSVAEVDICG